MTNFTWVDEITHEDYQNNQERLDYLNGVLPFQLPANATINRFKIQGFQDWFLEIDLTLPASDIPAFLDSIPGLQPTDTENHYEAQFGADHMDLQVDPDTGEIRIEYLET